MTEGQIMIELRDIREKADYTLNKMETRRDTRNERRRELYAVKHPPVPKHIDRSTLDCVRALMMDSIVRVLCD